MDNEFTFEMLAIESSIEYLKVLGHQEKVYYVDHNYSMEDAHFPVSGDALTLNNLKTTNQGEKDGN